MSILSCKTCHKYNQCKELCEEIEIYVNQDVVEWDGDDNLQLTSEIHLDNIAFQNSLVGESVTPDKKFFIAREWLKYKRSYREISEMYDVSWMVVYRLVAKIKKHMGKIALQHPL